MEGAGFVESDFFGGARLCDQGAGGSAKNAVTAVRIGVSANTLKEQGTRDEPATDTRHISSVLSE